MILTAASTAPMAGASPTSAPSAPSAIVAGVSPTGWDDSAGPAGHDPGRPIRLAFIGDVMLGRDVADVARIDPGSIFERLRPALVDADLALANLESPLTTRPHTGGGGPLEADPATARLLATAGLGVVDLANDHAADAGPATVLDTIAAAAAAGVRTVGAGADDSSAIAPVVLDLAGVRVGILAFDLTGRSAAAGPGSPGVSAWDTVTARRAVTALRGEVDLLVVGLHGGTGSASHPVPDLREAAGDLARWGADVVWGHGTHTASPVTVVSGSRHAVLAPDLGDALVGRQAPGAGDGVLLEVMADADGVLAMRTGTIGGGAGRAMFTGWKDPDGDAVALRSEWWTPVRPLVDEPARGCSRLAIDAAAAGLREGSVVVAASCGAITEPGAAEVAIAYRRPFTTEVLHGIFPGHRWSDGDGRAAHLAVMTPDARMVWGAASLPEPIGAVAVCSGSLAVGYTTLDDPALIAASAWTWRDFGFTTAPPLPRPTFIGCTDLDRDGATEPYIHRSPALPGGTSR